MRKPYVTLAVLVSVLLAGCSSPGGLGNYHEASNAEDFMEAMGYEWPLSVDGGTVACGLTSAGQGAVIFKPDGTEVWYAVNGVASAMPEFKNLDSIWSDDPSIPGAKKNIGNLLEHGLKQCLKD